MFRKIGEQVVDGAISKVKSQQQTEWIKMKCFADHSFAIELPTNLLVEEYIQLLSVATCPICQTQSLKKNGGM